MGGAVRWSGLLGYRANHQAGSTGPPLEDKSYVLCPGPFFMSPQSHRFQKSLEN